MHRRISVFAFLVVALALPLSASQFVQVPFDQIARESQYIVRGSITQTWSAWDDAHEVIYTYATLRVTRYFGETTGPDMLTIREVGGMVDGYVQEAICFPVLRVGEPVVMMLSPAEGGIHRIHAYNAGKFLVKTRNGVDVLTEDPVKQGEARLEMPAGPRIRTEAVEDLTNALTLNEFAEMDDAARAGTPLNQVQHRH
jgi:hypothetical protein